MRRAFEIMHLLLVLWRYRMETCVYETLLPVYIFLVSLCVFSFPTCKVETWDVWDILVMAAELRSQVLKSLLKDTNILAFGQ